MQNPSFCKEMVDDANLLQFTVSHNVFTIKYKKIQYVFVLIWEKKVLKSSLLKIFWG